MLPTAAVRRAATGELGSWVLYRPDGSLGMLHTLPELRGAGLAVVVVRALMVRVRRWLLHPPTPPREPATRHPYSYIPRPAAAAAVAAALAANDTDAVYVPHCHIRIGNTTSEAVFRKLGFVPVNALSWVISASAAVGLRPRPLRTAVASEADDVVDLLAGALDGATAAAAREYVAGLLADGAGTVFVAYALRGAVWPAPEPDAPHTVADYRAADGRNLPVGAPWGYPGALCYGDGALLAPADESDTLASVIVLRRTGATSVGLAALVVAPALRHTGIGHRMVDWAAATVAHPATGATSLTACLPPSAPAFLHEACLLYGFIPTPPDAAATTPPCPGAPACLSARLAGVATCPPSATLSLVVGHMH